MCLFCTVFFLHCSYSFLGKVCNKLFPCFFSLLSPLSRCLRTLHALFCPLATRSAIFYHFGFASQRFSNEWGRRSRMWAKPNKHTHTHSLEEAQGGAWQKKGKLLKNQRNAKVFKVNFDGGTWLGNSHWKSATKVKAKLRYFKEKERVLYTVYTIHLHMYRAALRLR